MNRNPWMFASNLLVYSFLFTSSVIAQDPSGSPSVVDAFPRQALACKNAGPQPDGQAGQGGQGPQGGQGGQGGPTAGKGGSTRGPRTGVRPIRVEQTGDQKIALADLCGAADKLWQQCIQEGDCVFLGIVMAWIDIAAQCEAGNSAACAVDEQANKAYWECTEAEKDESCNKLGTLLIQTNTCGTSDTDTPQK